MLPRLDNACGWLGCKAKHDLGKIIKMKLFNKEKKLKRIKISKLKSHPIMSSVFESMSSVFESIPLLMCKKVDH